MRVYRNVANCREPKRFGAWLYQIVVNECRTHLGRRTNRDRRFADPGELDRLAAGPDTDVLLREEIPRALDALPTEPREAFVLTTPEENAATYTFNKHVIQHRFCPTCGIHVFGEGADPKGQRIAAVNLRVIDGLDLSTLPVHHFDGRSI
jgi:hypothetical protein